MALLGRIPYRWEGRSLPLQLSAAIGVWVYLVVLHLNNDGLWYQGDSTRHAANGVFWADFLSSIPTNPVDYALSYYAGYPVINPTAYPPFFYFLEATAYRLFGISPFVAKGLVLGFVLVGMLYLVFWLRRWVGESAGWAGLLFALQPGIIVWGHAVMLNVPSTALCIAALYHWRRWLDDPSSRHLYLATAFCLLAVLTYLPSAVVALVMLCWALAKGQVALLFKRRSLAAMGFSLIVFLPWAYVALKWNPTHRMAAMYLGDYPFWSVATWTYYFEIIPTLVWQPVLIAAFASIGLGLSRKSLREELILGSIWFVVCYMWFTAISIKEERYVLLLIPPLICLTAVTISGGLQLLSNLLRRQAHQLVAPILMIILGFHLYMAPSVRVPSVSGFREIVAFLKTMEPAQRVFYDGHYNGVYSFLTLAEGHQSNHGIVLGSKLLYAMRIDPRFGGAVEFVSSPADVIGVIRKKCGCKWLVVERQIILRKIQAEYHLREALKREQFNLVRSFRVEAGDVTDVDVYEYLGNVSVPSEVELPFPILGEGITFSVKPFETQRDNR